jgi:heat shock protein HslJ
VRSGALIALLLALSACVDGGDTKGRPGRNPYVGTSWILANAGSDAPTIEFTDSRASGSTGCNRWFAQTAGSNDTLTFTAIGSTRRACEAEGMDAERTFIATLRATRSARVLGGVLVLRDGGGAELARFEPLD